jgi:hypothetical protein
MKITVTAVLSTTILPLDGTYQVKTLSADERAKLNLSGVPHYIGHPDTKSIVEGFGAIQAPTKLFTGLQPGQNALCFPIVQGKSSRVTEGVTTPNQSVTLEDLEIRLLTRWA